MRELVWLAEGKSREAWNHTAQLLAVLCELKRDPRKRRQPFSAEEFHPYMKRRRIRGVPYTKALLQAEAARWRASHTDG